MTEQQIYDIGTKIYTKVASPIGGTHFQAPINQFANMTVFPNAAFTDVVRNADTLYWSAWLDLSKEPLVIVDLL
jgi:hypothetical protein